jgi:hypothetical protein
MASLNERRLEHEIRAVEHLLHRGPISKHRGARAVHGAGPMGHFNDRVALLITNGVGTMWCAYAFAALALVSLPSALQELPSQGPQPLITWIAQTFLQLVLLSVIMVGQRVQQESSDQRAADDHQILGALHTLNQLQLEILQRLESGPEAEGGRGQAPSSPLT